MTDDIFDTIIVGAGISGISAAYHVQKYCPTKTYAVLEGRAALGGTWDLFRYPGVRSDSDMHTLGFSFKPWIADDAIADGQAILDYLQETVAAFGIAPHIRFNTRLTAASWDSKAARWTLTLETPEGAQTFICKFLIMGTGYYNYTKPYQPDFPNQAAFAGQIIHPQFWPDGLDYAGKRVIVIGSGATAATLIPAMAKTAAHVTMLQRSPTYMIARPRRDAAANALRKLFPSQLAYVLTRFKNIRMQQFLYNYSKRHPLKAAAQLRADAVKRLGPDYPIDEHFRPTYGPWDQRLCLLPEGDLFATLKAGQADVVTDTIQCFTQHGILLESGTELAADIIVTATGLTMELMSGVTLTVDGAPIPVRRTISYKACMYSGIPNLVSLFGYANASWTLKADLIARFATRLINHMDKTGAAYCVPDAKGVLPVAAPLMDLSSSYVKRAELSMPKQAAHDPWRVHHNYFTDKKLLGPGRLTDGVLRFEPMG